VIDYVALEEKVAFHSSRCKRE